MFKHVGMTLGFVCCFSTLAFGQAADSPFQVRALEKLKKKDVIVASNSGASSTVASPQNGQVCVNAYAFDPTGPMIGCCVCRINANALTQISIVNDVLEGRKPIPKSIVVKIMASSGTGGVCNGATVGTGSNVLMTGMLAWIRGTPMTPSTLSAAELTSLNNQCGVLHPSANLCPVCRS